MLEMGNLYARKDAIISPAMKLLLGRRLHSPDNFFAWLENFGIHAREASLRFSLHINFPFLTLKNF